VSADGTRIGYRRLGQGPSVILLHGGVNASQHMMKLARALADAFTLYLPDRRGRGMSGAFGPAYGIQREDEDLAGMVEHTAAECVFGPANGGLFALHGAIGLGQIRRVAAYEPLLLRGGPDDAAIRRTFTTMQQMIRGGRMGEAIMFSIHENVEREVRRGHMSSWAGGAMRAFPSSVGAGLIDLFLRHVRPRSGNVAWRELVASLPMELDPVLDTEGNPGAVPATRRPRAADLRQRDRPDVRRLRRGPARGTSAFHSPAAAGAEPRLSTDLRQAGDDRCSAAAVLCAANDLTAKAHIREAATELFAEVGHSSRSVQSPGTRCSSPPQTTRT
jgi:pimeloyl-ACP methyl ester carboxylesterase